MDFEFTKGYSDSVAASGALRRLKDTIQEFQEYVGDAIEISLAVQTSKIGGKGVFYSGSATLKKHTYIGLYLGKRTLTREAKQTPQA